MNDKLVADIFDDMGHLFLGSRLKRLAERFQNDATKIFANSGFDLQPAQMPLLAALDRYGPMTVSVAVERIGLSQPAVTRVIRLMLEAGLIKASREHEDLRHKTIALSEHGAAVAARIKIEIWPRVELAVQHMCSGLTGSFLENVMKLESELEKSPMTARVAAMVDTDIERGLSIITYDDALAHDFYAINAQWIETMFVLEPTDIDVLSRPRDMIIDKGGVILFVQSVQHGIVGACALKKTSEGCFELTKMGVLENARGLKAGEFLLAAILDRARSMEIERLYLLTSKKCEAAIHLYEKFGFEHSDEIMHDYGQSYERCDVAMKFRF